MTHPNILLIVADCLRSDYLSGEKGQADTPFLNKMKTKGVLFTDMISTMSITTPNFTSILSGRYPVEHGVRFLSNQIPAKSDLVMMPHLKEQGYQTYALMTGPLFEETGLGHGFDVYDYRDRKKYLDGEWGKQLINDLRNGRFQEPWVILLHLWELHQPRRVTAESSHLPGTPYEQALGGMDRHIERIWKVISETAERPSIAALTGDHGEWVETNKLNELWRKGMARLQTMTMPNTPKASWHGFHVYEYLTRVPLLVWGTDLPPGPNLVRQQVRQIDLLPTLMDAAGLPQPTTTGQSAWPLAKGQPLLERPAFLEASGDVSLLQSDKWVLGVRHEGWKYFYRPQKPGEEALFNLTADPQEKTNLANQYQSKATEMKQLIETQYLELGMAADTADLDLSETEARLRDLGYF